MNNFNKSPEIINDVQSKVEVKLNFRLVEPKTFIERVGLLPLPLFAFLTPYSEEDYKEMQTKLFLSEDNESGFGLNPDGHLVSVFSLKRERGVILVREAKEVGANYLSCMGEKLLELYSSFGFKVIKKEDWKDEHTPKHWDYEKFGRPNVYEMGL